MEHVTPSDPSTRHDMYHHKYVTAYMIMRDHWDQVFTAGVVTSGGRLAIAQEILFDIIQSIHQPEAFYKDPSSNHRLFSSFAKYLLSMQKLFARLYSIAACRMIHVTSTLEGLETPSQLFVFDVTPFVSPDPVTGFASSTYISLLKEVRRIAPDSSASTSTSTYQELLEVKRDHERRMAEEAEWLETVSLVFEKKDMESGTRVFTEHKDLVMNYCVLNY
jgi:hypothetical protein